MHVLYVIVIHGGVVGQAGYTEFSRAPGLTSAFQGSINFYCGTEMFLSALRRISSLFILFFYE